MDSCPATGAPSMQRQGEADLTVLPIVLAVCGCVNVMLEEAVRAGDRPLNQTRTSDRLALVSEHRCCSPSNVV